MADSVAISKTCFEPYPSDGDNHPHPTECEKMYKHMEKFSRYNKMKSDMLKKLHRQHAAAAPIERDLAGTPIEQDLAATNCGAMEQNHAAAGIELSSVTATAIEHNRASAAAMELNRPSAVEMEQNHRAAYRSSAANSSACVTHSVGGNKSVGSVKKNKKRRKTLINLIAQKKFNPARDPCSVLWDDLVTMELSPGKKDAMNSPPSRLIIYLESRSLEGKDQVRIIKCQPNSNQTFEVYSSIELARTTYGPSDSKV
ncbi:hypothetical protein DM860_013412 [Cuscuta australis]|uniref:Uncharacterized protein n=1 Tax=Cuscuta australis TaxID=267555 RepID=A0A328DP44_9ASTE|nr:hypothetical protein DM860_013412 [Cuscuta australis]